MHTQTSPPADRFARLARLVARNRRRVLAIAGLAVIAGLALTPVFQSKLLGVGYDTPGTESYRAAQAIAERSGFDEQAAVVVSSDRHRVSSPVFRRAIRAATAAVRERGSAVEGPAPGSARGTVARNGRAAYAVVGLRGDAARRQDTAKALQEALDRAMPSGMQAGLSGNAALIADLIHVEHADSVKAEAVGLPVAGAVLLVAFGSVVAALLPLLLGVCGLLVAFGIVAGVMLVMDFNAFTETIVAMIGMAVGIDYALLLVRRFREERAGEADAEVAMARTLSTAGRTITFSGAILATSLLPLALIELPFFTEAAVATMIVVAVEVLLALTLLPALLLTLGPRLDRGRLPWRRRAASTGAGRWNRWAHWVMRRPATVLIAGAALLLAAAAPALNLQTGIDLNARAMKDQESVKALTALTTNFPDASLGPVTVLVTGEPGRLRAAGARVRAQMERGGRLRGIAAQPLGRDALVVTGNTTAGVDTAAAVDTVRSLRTRLGESAVPGAKTQVAGITAEGLDYSDETNAITPLVIGLSLALSFGLLLMVFRSPLLAFKAILMNLLSIGAAFGLTVLVFQEGLGESVFAFESLGYLQSWTPLTLFMLLFGLSMDYEVFMVTRMREEWEACGDNAEAVARGLERTGGVVTSAAAIMVAIFAAFTLNRIPEIKQLGFGLAVAVLLDATIVRAMLVPAFMKLAGRWNWWMPRPLERLLPDLRH